MPYVTGEITEAQREPRDGTGVQAQHRSGTVTVLGLPVSTHLLAWPPRSLYQGQQEVFRFLFHWAHISSPLAANIIGYFEIPSFIAIGLVWGKAMQWLWQEWDKITLWSSQWFLCFRCLGEGHTLYSVTEEELLSLLNLDSWHCSGQGKSSSCEFCDFLPVISKAAWLPL